MKLAQNHFKVSKTGYNKKDIYIKSSEIDQAPKPQSVG